MRLIVGLGSPYFGAHHPGGFLEAVLDSSIPLVSINGNKGFSDQHMLPIYIVHPVNCLSQRSSSQDHFMHQPPKDQSLGKLVPLVPPLLYSEVLQRLHTIYLYLPLIP